MKTNRGEAPRRLRSRRRHGFSIIELLVAIIIIGILVAVLVPVISTRTEQARQSAVRADVAEIANMMERVGVDTGYYIRLFALNDVLRGDGVGFNRPEDPNDRADGLTDYSTSVSNPYYQFPPPNSLFITPATGDFAPGSRDSIINRLLLSETSYTGSITWNGPYMNWHRDNTLYSNLLAPDGIPDDPWGNNYLFFTREGLVLEPDGLIVDGVNQANDGTFTQGAQWETDIFDRPTILSLGPDGVPGDGIPGNEFGDGDDVVYEFGK